MTEAAFHKLGKTEHFELIDAGGFRPSKPAERHWLGEGIYFFLNPAGLYWARRWPCNTYDPRTDSLDGIIETSLETENALDLRDDGIRNKTHQLVNKIKLKIKMEQDVLLKQDGAVFAAIFKLGAFKDVIATLPTAIIANFDKAYERYRIPDSGVFLTVEEMKIGKTAQIQACVVDSGIIGKIGLYSR